MCFGDSSEHLKAQHPSSVTHIYIHTHQSIHTHIYQVSMYIHACKCTIFDLVVHSSNARCKRTQLVESKKIYLGLCLSSSPWSIRWSRQRGWGRAAPAPAALLLQLQGSGLPGGCSSPTSRGHSREKVAPSSARGHPSMGELGGSSNMTASTSPL